MARTADAPGQPGNLGVAAVLGAVSRVFARTWRGLVVADALFKALSALLTLGYASIVLTAVMTETGRSAVTNTDIAQFLLHPRGALLAFVGSAGALFLIMVEQAILMAVAALQYYRPGRGGWEIARAAAAAAHRIARLAGLLVVIGVTVALPPAAITGLLYKLALGGHDINYYLSARPPAFLAVAGVSAGLWLAAAAVLAWVYVRSLLAVPVILSERVRPVTAVLTSFARTRGYGWRIAALLAAWHGSWFIASWLCLEGFRRLAGFGFRMAETAVGAVTGAAMALVGLAVTAAALSFGAWAGHALLVMKLYVALQPEGFRPEPLPGPRGEARADRPLARRTAVAVALLLAAVLSVSLLLVHGLSRLGHVQITAHRGYSKVAPENTLSAVRKAVEAGADWAEIDVQETKDGVVVVTHDRDLMRMARDPRKLTEITFEELRSADVGSAFAPEFAGERVPALEEVFAFAKGKIKLNIELKYYGEDPRLAPDVARLIRKNGFDRQCFVASLDYPSLEDVKKENPAVRTGAIVSAGVGDITKLDADLLSVNAGLVDFWFLRRARRAGKEVHVWTVDDPEVAKVLMGRGVASLITNDVEGIVRARKEWESLTQAQKLLLTVRYLLGLGEAKSDEVTHQGEL